MKLDKTIDSFMIICRLSKLQTKYSIFYYVYEIKNIKKFQSPSCLPSTCKVWFGREFKFKS